MLVPVWLQAGLWGLIAGSALLVGAALGLYARAPQRCIAVLDGTPESIVIGVSMMGGRA